MDIDDTAGYRVKRTLSGHEGEITSLKFSGAQTTGKYLASASVDKTVKVWNTETWGVVHTLVGHSKAINDVSWSHCGKLIATASNDFTLRLWASDTGTCLRQMEGHTNYAFCCAFNPQGSMLVSGSYDETLKVWNVRDGRCIRSIPAHADPVTAVDYSHDGSMFLSSSFDGLVRLWDSATGRCLRTIIDEPSPPIGIARFSPNSRYIFIGALANRIDLWDYMANKKLKAYTGHQNVSHCIFLAVSNASKQPLLISGSEDGSIVAYDVNTAQVLQRFEDKTRAENKDDTAKGVVLAVSAHPNKLSLATGGFEKSIKIWEADGF